jgi:tetratricopeptide (TPR) repeat protein
VPRPLRLTRDRRDGTGFEPPPSSAKIAPRRSGADVPDVERIVAVPKMQRSVVLSLPAIAVLLSAACSTTPEAPPPLPAAPVVVAPTAPASPTAPTAPEAPATSDATVPPRAALPETVLAPVAPAAPKPAAPRAPAAPAKLLPGLDKVHRAIRTSAPEAQRWFDQGLALVWGFNHTAAIAAFERATELDPQCAMAWWGLAFAHGPHINNTSMDEEASRRAHEAAQRALALVEDRRRNAAGPVASERVERDLVHALAVRYAWPPPEDRGALDRAFADAMREVWHQHPLDADVGTIFAEALMDTAPWDLWTPAGEPQPETQEVVATIGMVLALDHLHPQANHLAIHAWEASPMPERAAACADVLRDRVPGSGHLVHMPAHIDLRLGRYDQAIRANQSGIAADLAYVAATGQHGLYDMYRAHNYHFLVYAAMFEGRSALALDQARELVRQMPAETVDAMPDVLEAFLAVPYHALVRFGRWNDVLAEPEPPATRPVTRATHFYARGMALSALDRLAEADAAHAEFLRAVEAVPESASVGNNAAATVLAIGRALLEGELLYRKGEMDAAFARLREAVAQDEVLKYDEPWGWMQPPAHALGALLLEQGRVEEAEAVYRADLVRHPRNGWALRGLHECLQRRGAVAEAEAVAAELKQAWARADVQPTASCYCRRG